MTPKVALSAGLALLTLTTGLAAGAHGTWSGLTQLAEPNTRWDDPEYMPQAPNRAAVEKVYFNGVMIKGSPVPLGPQYELQAADGNVMGPDGYVFSALLGFWRDCNRDGYVGAKNVPSSFGNLEVYPRQGQAIDVAICPLGSPYNPINAATGQPDGLIDEFRWIGPGAGCDAYEDACPGAPAQPPARLCVPPSQNPPTGLCANGVQPNRFTQTTNDLNDVTDNASRVWADWNFPGGRHVYSQGLYGPLVVDGKPPGTYYDSDGTLQYVDDAAGRDPSRTLGATWTSKPNVGECDASNAFLGGPHNGLPTGTCGAWPLYQMKRLLNDGDARSGTQAEPSPLVTAFDTEKDSNGNGNPCDDAVSQPVTAPNPVSPSGATRVAYVALPDAEPRANPNPLVEGSAAGTAAHLSRSLNGTSAGGASAGRCGPFLGVAVGSTGNLESNELEAEFTHRLPTDTLNFTEDARYRFLAEYGYAAMPTDQGGATGTVTDGTAWFGRYTWTPRPPRHGWGATTLAFATFYADVTPQAFVENRQGATPVGALPGKKQDAYAYGVPEACAAVLTGPSRVNPANDWECSQTVWLAKRALDGSRDAAQGYRPVLGDAYDLRDVDCHDDTVSDALGVRPGLVSCEDVHR